MQIAASGAFSNLVIAPDTAIKSDISFSALSFSFVLTARLRQCSPYAAFFLPGKAEELCKKLHTHPKSLSLIDGILQQVYKAVTEPCKKRQQDKSGVNGQYKKRKQFD